MEANPETVFILCDNKYNMNQILENNRDSFQRMIRFKVNFKDFTRDELKQILHYLEVHLQDQDNHLASQDRILENLTKGE